MEKMFVLVLLLFYVFSLQSISELDLKEVQQTIKAKNDTPQSKINQKSKLHQYFQFFNLSQKYFDHRWDKKYSEYYNQVKFKGGWPYYRPVKSKKFGLDVLGRYDNENNQWLSGNSRKQWPVAFHGIRYPHSKSNFNLNNTILEDILQGLQTGTMLKPGINNRFQNMKSVNTGQLIQKGVYCTPHFHIALKYAQPLHIESINQSYSLILQCRVNPMHIKVCQDETKWVVNNGQHIRPYAIILITEKQKMEYKQSIIQFGQQFKYKRYKYTIQRHLKYYIGKELKSTKQVKLQL